MVTFVVGPESTKQSFVVHKNAACAHSPFFKAAFESKMLEGTTQTMRLDDVDEKTFGMLVHYLYTSQLETSLYIINDPRELKEAGLPYDPNLLDYDLVQLVKLWKLGERVLMPLLQNKVMAELFCVTRSLASASEDQLKQFVEFVSENSGMSPGDGKDVLRELVISIAAWSKYKGIMKWLPKDICGEAAERLKERYFTAGREKVDYEDYFYVEVHRDEKKEIENSESFYLFFLWLALACRLAGTFGLTVVLSAS
ncbi:hypothetical protein DL98DRAFT_581064 [Cadophora sp. DSE1049]|nr:hypothetical protein DL98DRAFT_581064 [Cadophora sp. DSE1049]